MIQTAEERLTEDTSELAEDVHQMVSFVIGTEEYAVDILEVQEIIRMVEITKVPKAPHYVEGVINLRGKVIPIVDLRLRFGLSTEERTKETRIIVVDISRIIIGMIVDVVSEVLRIPASLVEPPPSSKQGASDFYKGVGKIDNRLLIFLDLNRVLGQEKFSF